MARFDINNLVVLHLYNYMRPRGEKDPLAQVEKECQVVKLSTCMRTIYVLNKDALKSEGQQKAYQALIDYIERRDMYSASTKFESLEGAQAYEFLLYWVLGGVNPAKTFQDSRILGDVRQIWTKLCGSPSPRAQTLVSLYKTLFNDLFADSGQLRKLISVYESLEPTSLALTLKTACVNCARARIQGFLTCLVNFDYSAFAENTHLLELKDGLLRLQEKLSSRVKVPEGEEALQSIVAEQQRDGIRKRLLEIEQLLLVLDHLNPSVVMGKLEASEKLSELPEQSDKSVPSSVSTRLEVDDCGKVKFFIKVAAKQAEQQTLDTSLALKQLELN
ncbi:hypothetical protein [Legionella sp. km772]|uniref:hypothetical protein n=1 Tax=Legionella sp. km772 TaxID=2498111 RepID=UPI000F8E517B|nr:hypothetical protein [Legionella sp. km772]RUR11001.1 hypothetical protein ELY15_07545 [Legionella sp. km772]